MVLGRVAASEPGCPKVRVHTDCSSLRTGTVWKESLIFWLPVLRTQPPSTCPRLVVKTLLCQDPQSRSVIVAFRRGADRAVRTGGASWWRLLPETTSRTTCLQTVFNAAWGSAGAPHSWVSLGWDAGPSAGHASFRSSRIAFVSMATPP